MANVLVVAERRGRVSEAPAARFLDLLDRLPIVVDDEAPDPAVVLGIGRRHRLSAYEACYLALAERLGAPLATLDRPLGEACRAAGVAVLG